MMIVILVYRNPNIIPGIFILETSDYGSKLGTPWENISKVFILMYGYTVILLNSRSLTILKLGTGG